jgi:bifunctional oligoribonuclease and PAP phosphatase NrnA
MAINWKPLRQLIDANQRFVLSSHVRPDADALGSELAFASILANLGKSVRVVNPSAAPAHLDFLDPDNRVMKIGTDISIDEVCDTDVHIVLDTSAWAQLQDVGKALRKTTAKKVVIDHHVSSDDIGAMVFRDGKAEATGTLVFRFADSCGLSLSEEAAGFLYCAIATDTGWFRFPSTTGETMRIAGRLMDLGAEPPTYYRLLYERYSAARMKLIGRALSHMQIECDGRLAYIVVRDEDFRVTGASPPDTEDLVNECLRIEGTEAAFVAIEQNNHSLKFSLRSRSSFDVAAIAEQFGGGGHKQAAGTVVQGPIANALEKVRAAMRAGLSARVS